MIKKIYFGIALILDIFIFIFLMLGWSFDGFTKDNIYIIVLIFIVLVFAIISGISLVKLIKGKSRKLVRTSLLMKISAFFIISAFGFLGYEDGIYAFVIFFVLGILCGIATVYLVKKGKTTDNISSKPSKNIYEFSFKGEYLWDAVAAEYMKLHGIADISSLSKSESNKIYDYTVSYLSYFFYWLASKGFLSEEFYSETGISDNIIPEMLVRAYTPVEVLAAVDYTFKSSYINEKIVYFFKNYYDNKFMFVGDKPHYLYDYMDAIGNLTDRFYCVDFSWDILKVLTAKIDECYEDYNSVLSRQKLDYYDEEELTEGNSDTFHSARFNADLKICKAGPKFKGIFPENYINKCIENMENLSMLQLKRIERWFNDSYGEGKVIKLSDFRANKLCIMEPEKEGDIVYTVVGEADFEEEHGISFGVRNGIAVCTGYSYDFEDLYTRENVKRYERLLDTTDYTKINSVEILEDLSSKGALVKVKILPELENCILELNDELQRAKLKGGIKNTGYIYITKRAYEEKLQYEKRLQGIISYVKANTTGIVPKIKYTALCEINSEENIESLVPRDITIFSLEKNLPLKILFNINVWD